MASRLRLDRRGRLIAEVTSPAPLQEVGQRFVIVGNHFESAGSGIGWLGRSRSSRPPTPHEIATSHLKHPPPEPKPEPEAEDLDDDAAIESARLEQQRAPVDLFGRAA